MIFVFLHNVSCINLITLHTDILIDPITSAADGWGLKTYPNNERLVSYEVNIRVLAWNFDSDSNKCRWTWNSTIYANQQSTEAPKMIFSSPIEDMNSVLVLVSVSMLLIQKSCHTYKTFILA